MQDVCIPQAVPPDPAGVGSLGDIEHIVLLNALIEGNVNILLGFRGWAVPYAIPPNSMPTQETGPLRRSPRGIPADVGW